MKFLVKKVTCGVDVESGFGQYIFIRHHKVMRIFNNVRMLFMAFQIHALSESMFDGLFDLSDSDLAKKSAMRMIADSKLGFPCRISLAEADIGDTVILVNHQHQPNATPYRASHAIFVRKNVTQAKLRPDELPEVLKMRLLSVRAFNNTHNMIDADIAEGADVEKIIRRMFENPDVDYLHLHNAKQGCFAASVSRA